MVIEWCMNTNVTNTVISLLYVDLKSNYGPVFLFYFIFFKVANPMENYFPACISLSNTQGTHNLL